MEALEQRISICYSPERFVIFTSNRNISWPIALVLPTTIVLVDLIVNCDLQHVGNQSIMWDCDCLARPSDCVRYIDLQIRVPLDDQ